MQSVGNRHTNMLIWKMWEPAQKKFQIQKL